MKTGNLSEWHKLVLMRDKNTCQKCGDNKQVIAHHKKERKVYPKLELIVENGIALCQRCHYNEPRQLYLFQWFQGFWWFPRKLLRGGRQCPVD